MKKLIIILTLLIHIGVNAQTYIDHEQTRIDAMDGKLDNFIALRDLDLRNSANYTYMFLIDELQLAILDNDNINNDNKVNLYKEIHKELFEINEDELLRAVTDEKKYTFLLRWVKAYGFEDINKLMDGNKDESFLILNFIYPFAEVEKFLGALPTNYIDQLLYRYSDFRKAAYAQTLLEDLVIKAPETAKKYFIRNQPIYNALFMSTNAIVSKILEINEKYRRNTKAYILLDKIMNNELTIDEADAIGNSEAYFKNLLEIRAKENPLAELSLDREINYEALEFVREVNHLHEENNTTRFAGIQSLTATELYTLIVYGEDEIFTSSFNGVYEKLTQKMKDEGLTGYQLLDAVGFNKFRMFIKMLSYYGKINSFLATMTKAEREYVLRSFVGGIQQSKHRIEDAVSIADAISAIEDKEILKIFEEEIFAINNIKDLDSDSRLIYGLLIKLFNPKVQTHRFFFDSIANLYFTPPIEKIERNVLLGRDGKNVQKHFFYDDDDGEASFNTFVATFRNKSNWIITDEDEYIKITSTNNRVKIYANKPKFDETAWYYVDKEMERNGEDVEFIIHRGHSYYVDYTIEQIPKTSKLIMLGSCGGYNKLSSLLEVSNNAQIISTKQIGSMGVNNPLIFTMAEKVRLGEDLVWKDYWEELKVYFNTTGATTSERFDDYVPPHQNLGAKFIAAYKTYSWVGDLTN